MQIENEPKTRLDMNGKSGVLSALRKKMSLNYNTRDECKKSKNRHIHNPTTKRRNLKSIEHSSITDNNLLKRKMKTLSSNTIGLSKILRNMERKQEKRNVNEKPNFKSKKLLKQIGLVKKKRSLKKQTELNKKIKDRKEKMKLNKPPLLPKNNNYTSHNPNVQRKQMKGLIRRKLSMGIQLNDHSFSSKPNSPSNNLRSKLKISPRYFKTMNKDMDMEQDSKISIVNSKNTKSKMLNIESEFINKEKKETSKLTKIDHLKRILVRKKKHQNQKCSQMSSSMRESINKDLQNNFSQNISYLQLKTPINVHQEGSPNPPLNPFIPKNHKKAKNIFSFNKDSKDPCNMNTSQVHSNNTSLLYSYGLNSSKPQNSFIYLKNRIGNTSILNNESVAHFRTDSLKSTINPSNSQKPYQSFLLSKNLGEPKKRSKSFFEINNNDLMRTSINVSNGGTLNNISALGLQNLNTSISQNLIENDQLSNFIKSIQEKEENNLSVKTIEEESEFSIEKQISKISKRPPTVEGIAL